MELLILFSIFPLILGVSEIITQILCDHIPAVKRWFEGDETEEDEN